MQNAVLSYNNRLLDSLPADEAARFVSFADTIPMPVRTVLYQPGIRPKYAYFLTSGMASIVWNNADGSVIEVGIVGQEGLVGAMHLLGHLELPTQCFMQIAGTARRIPLSDLERAFASPSELHQKISDFIQFRTISAEQLVACNAHHSIEQRLARWLLNVQDRLQVDKFALTHEFLADMLAVHRPTVSIVAKHFMTAGVIIYRHGHIEILQRAQLEKLACECHTISHNLLINLYSRKSEAGVEHLRFPELAQNGYAHPAG